MSAPDPIVTGITIATALQVAKQGQDLLAAAMGHPGESIGTMLGNLGRRRIANIEQVWEKAGLTLLNLQLPEPPADIPLNTSVPILEAASLEEEPSRQDRWANLLANAADPRQLNPVQAAFAKTLNELGHREVRFLDALYKHASEANRLRGDSSRPEDVQYNRVSMLDVYFDAGLSSRQLAHMSVADSQGEHADEMLRQQREYRTMTDILVRLNVMEIIVNQIGHSGFDGKSPDLVRNFRLTAFGADFIRACQPPPTQSNNEAQ